MKQYDSIVLGCWCLNNAYACKIEKYKAIMEVEPKELSTSEKQLSQWRLLLEGNLKKYVKMHNFINSNVIPEKTSAECLSSQERNESIGNKTKLAVQVQSS